MHLTAIPEENCQRLCQQAVGVQRQALKAEGTVLPMETYMGRIVGVELAKQGCNRQLAELLSHILMQYRNCPNVLENFAEGMKENL